MRYSTIVALVLIPSVLAACGQGPATREITETRVVESPQVDTSAQGMARFNLPGMPSAMPTQTAAPLFAWDTPEGWTEQAASSMRPVNLSVTKDGQTAECYVTALGGTGGGLEDNLNRWRNQMGQPALTPAEISALPKITLLGQEATYATISGTFNGAMGSTVQAADALMLGAILVSGNQSVFVKMVGPRTLVEGEKAAFENFVKSLRLDDGHGHGHPPTQVASSNAPAASAESFDPSTMTWTAPENWKRGPEQTMRLMTYFLDEAQKAECVVYAFPGDVGGLGANINRWQAQMGQPVLTAEQISALPTITVFGQPATLVEIAGDYTGMSGGTSAGYTMLAAVAPAGSHTVFFKLTGPTDIITTEKDNFIAFCESFKR